MHSVFVTGYEQSGEVVRFANSWGVGWGQAGHGSVSMDYLRRYLYESWAWTWVPQLIGFLVRDLW